MLNNSCTILNNWREYFVKFCSDRSAYSKYLVNTSGTAFSRKRKMPLQSLLSFLITFRAMSNSAELLNFFGSTGQEDQCVTKGNLSKQRQKIKSKVFVALNNMLLLEFYYNGKNLKKRHGRFVLAVDGTPISLPYFAGLEEEFGMATNQKGAEIPMALLVQCFDVLNGVFVGAVLIPYTKSEIDGAKELIDALPLWLTDNSIFVFDRGYAGYAFIQYLMEKRVMFVMRIRNGFSPFLDDFAKSNLRYKDVLLRPGATSVSRATKKKRPMGDIPVFVHAVRAVLPSRQVEVCISNLSWEMVTPRDVCELYKLRWNEEVAIGGEKNQLQFEIFSSYRSDGIRQDIFSQILAFNILSILIREADAVIERRSAGKTKYKHQANGNMAITILKTHLAVWFSSNIPKNGILTKCVKEMSQYSEAIRPDRSYPRNFRVIKVMGKYITLPNYRTAL